MSDKSNKIKPSEVSQVLLSELQGIDLGVQYAEVGTVLQVSDGVVRIFGLRNAEASELLEFDCGLKAVVMNLEEDNVGAVLLGPTDLVKEGDMVRRTGRTVSIDVGESMLGRVINPLGEPIDGGGEILGEKVEMPLDRKAPGVIFRQPVSEPLQTGLKAIDAMVLHLCGCGPESVHCGGLGRYAAQVWGDGLYRGGGCDGIGLGGDEVLRAFYRGSDRGVFPRYGAACPGGVR